MNRSIVMTSAILGFLAVILGALGAHALKEVLSESSLASFATGVRYQAWHAIALLIVGLNANKLSHLKGIFLLWTIGVVLFSGSIYGLTLSSINDAPLSFLGPITPIGGLLMIAGWALLFISALKNKKP